MTLEAANTIILAASLGCSLTGILLLMRANTPTRPLSPSEAASELAKAGVLKRRATIAKTTAKLRQELGR